MDERFFRHVVSGFHPLQGRSHDTWPVTTEHVLSHTGCLQWDWTSWALLQARESNLSSGSINQTQKTSESYCLFIASCGGLTCPGLNLHIPLPVDFTSASAKDILTDTVRPPHSYSYPPRPLVGFGGYVTIYSFCLFSPRWGVAYLSDQGRPVNPARLTVQVTTPHRSAGLGGRCGRVARDNLPKVSELVFQRPLRPRCLPLWGLARFWRKWAI